MCSDLHVNIKEILCNEMNESAIDVSLEAIVKIIFDGFVRKELYKEKLSEIENLSNDLTTAKEELSTAEKRLKELIEEDNARNIKEISVRLSAEILELLEVNEVNPYFSKILLKDLMNVLDELGIDDSTEDSEIIAFLNDRINALKCEMPCAFGEILIEMADIAIRPTKINLNVNPWIKETLNLTEQTKLFRENPGEALRMAEEAGKKI